MNPAAREKIRRAHYPAHNGFEHYCRDGCESADRAGICDAIRALDALEALEKLRDENPSCMEAEHGGHPTCPHMEEALRLLQAQVAELEKRNALHMELANQQNERNKERADEAERWKTAVIDACVVSWASWDLNDPRATLRALIAQEVSTALDPLVSQAAADLMARGRRVGLDVAIGIVKEMDEWDAGLVEDLELARDEPSK